MAKGLSCVSTTQWYAALEKWIDNMSELLVRSYDNKLTPELLLKKDPQLNETLLNIVTDVSVLQKQSIIFFLEAQQPYESFFHLLTKVSGIKYIKVELLEQISIEALIDPLNKDTNRNLLTEMASSYCIKDLPHKILKLLTNDIISKYLSLDPLSIGYIKELINSKINELEGYEENNSDHYVNVELFGDENS